MTTGVFSLDQTACLVTATVTAPQFSGADAQELVGELMGRMRNDNAQQFIVDLSAVEFIASDSLGSLVSFLQDLEHVRGRMALVCRSKSVLFLFKVTRLDAVFPICDDVASAREAIA